MQKVLQLGETQEFSSILPQKIGHSQELLRNSFQDAEKISAV
jgi:hypothetical protein